MRYKKTTSFGTRVVNFIFTVLHLILHTGRFAVLIVKLSDWCAEQQFRSLFIGPMPNILGSMQRSDDFAGTRFQHSWLVHYVMHKNRFLLAFPSLIHHSDTSARCN